MEKIPNMFIVGAAKAGTTSLYYYLNQCPQIYFSPIKEPNYFSSDIKIEEFSNKYKKRTIIVNEKYFNSRPLKHLQLSFIRNESQYNSLFDEVRNEKIIGEASTTYLFSNQAAKNIFRFNPKCKILIVLRNPFERTFSHYLMALRYGFTTLPFREAIIQDQENHVKGWGQSELFIELSLYYEQLKRYFDVFPPNQIKILFFNELVTNPKKTISDINWFLKVPSNNLFDMEAKNQAEIPRFMKLNKLLTDTGIKKAVGKTMGKNLKEMIKPILFSKDKKKVQFSSEDKHFLLPFFDENIKKTSQLINKDLSNWFKV